MQITTISSKGQITLPKHLLSLLGINPGERILIEEQGKTILIKPMRYSLVDKVAGSLRKYIPVSKRNLPFPQIMQETQKKTAAKLARKRWKQTSLILISLSVC